MVCNRCISSVDETFNTLKIKFEYISLGQYNINTISDNLYLKLKTELQNSGFDLIDDNKKIIALKIKGTPKSLVMRFSFSAMSRTIFSDSITQGPAIRASGFFPPILMGPVEID